MTLLWLNFTFSKVLTRQFASPHRSPQGKINSSFKINYQNNNLRKRKSGSTSVVAGYGSTSATSNSKPEYLVYAHVNQVQLTECKKKYAEFVGTIPGDVYIGSNVLCAGDNQTDACSGENRKMPKTLMNRIFR